MKLKEKGIEKSIIHIDFENIIDIDLYIMKTRKYHIGANTGVDPDMSTMRWCIMIVSSSVVSEFQEGWIGITPIFFI